MSKSIGSWSYPLHLIRIDTGFASVVDESDGKPRCSVVVFTTMERMETFLIKAQLTGKPRELSNDREFSFFARSLKPPITHVVFDSNPLGKQVNPRWSIAIADLLKDHLPLSESPWGYPIYVIREQSGFSCIEGATKTARRIQALCVFTRLAGANEYRENAKIKGNTQRLSTPAELRGILMHLGITVEAIALDPTASGATRKANTCVSVATVMDKYLPDDEVE